MRLGAVLIVSNLPPALVHPILFPQPRFSRCNMLVPWRSIKGRHHATAMCKKGAERKRRPMAEAELRDSTERDFEAYGKPLETVS